MDRMGRIGSESMLWRLPEILRYAPAIEIAAESGTKSAFADSGMQLRGAENGCGVAGRAQPEL